MLRKSWIVGLFVLAAVIGAIFGGTYVFAQSSYAARANIAEAAEAANNHAALLRRGCPLGGVFVMMIRVGSSGPPAMLQTSASGG